MACFDYFGQIRPRFNVQISVICLLLSEMSVERDENIYLASEFNKEFDGGVQIYLRWREMWKKHENSETIW